MISQYAREVLNRWRGALPDVVASSLGAVGSWEASRFLLGHQMPIFASVAAILCLAPGIPSRRWQAVNMMLGLMTGIAVGELTLFGPWHSHSGLFIFLATFFAMLAATSFGLLPVIAC